jgi:hypothetical protein
VHFLAVVSSGAPLLRAADGVKENTIGQLRRIGFGNGYYYYQSGVLDHVFLSSP